MIDNLLWIITKSINRIVTSAGLNGGLQLLCYMKPNDCNYKIELISQFKVTRIASEESVEIVHEDPHAGGKFARIRWISHCVVSVDDAGFVEAMQTCGKRLKDGWPRS